MNFKVFNRTPSSEISIKGFVKNLSIKSKFMIQLILNFKRKYVLLESPIPTTIKTLECNSKHSRLSRMSRLS